MTTAGGFSGSGTVLSTGHWLVTTLDADADSLLGLATEEGRREVLTTFGSRERASPRTGILANDDEAEDVFRCVEASETSDCTRFLFCVAEDTGDLEMRRPRCGPLEDSAAGREGPALAILGRSEPPIIWR